VFDEDEERDEPRANRFVERVLYDDRSDLREWVARWNDEELDRVGALIASALEKADARKAARDAVYDRLAFMLDLIHIEVETR
jgi:hypothetical protein